MTQVQSHFDFLIDDYLTEFSSQSESLWKFAHSRFFEEGRGLLICVIQRKFLLNAKFKPSLEYITQTEAEQFRDEDVSILLMNYNPEQEFIIIVSILLETTDANGNDSVLKARIMQKNENFVKLYDENDKEIRGNVNIQERHPHASCAICDIVTSQLKICTRCKSVLYCSVRCQKKDWKEHKFACSKFA